MTKSTITKRDFIWVMNGTEYKIMNVPCELLETEREEFISLDVAIKMEMLKELMLKEEIPSEIDFELALDLSLDN